MSEEMEKQVKKALRCLSCNAVTYHEGEFIEKETFADDTDYDPSDEESNPYFWEERIYRVWKCAGCGSRRFEIYIQEHGPDPDKVITNSTIYPEFKPGNKKIQRYSKIDKRLYELYRESVITFNAGAKIACAGCLRALLEGILIEKGIRADQGKKNDLFNKINKLKTMPLVPNTTVDLLHSFRFMGNEALHQLVAPGQLELGYAIEAMEQLIYFIYEAEHELHQKLRTLSLFRNRHATGDEELDENITS